DVLKRLEGLKGEQFDRAYLQQLVKDHEKAVALFQREADRGKNAELKQFANDTLPTLKDHLQMAKNLYHEVGATKHNERTEMGANKRNQQQQKEKQNEQQQQKEQ